MRPRLALLATAGLTIFVMGTGGLLAVSLAPEPETVVAPQATVAAAAVPKTPVFDQGTVDVLIDRAVVLEARLVEANQTIVAANASIAALETERDQLAAQNGALLEREAAYRAQIERANALLEERAIQVASAPVAAAVPAPAPPVVQQEDDDRDGHEEREHEDEEDDDDHEEHDEDEDDHEEDDDD